MGVRDVGTAVLIAGGLLAAGCGAAAPTPAAPAAASSILSPAPPSVAACPPLAPPTNPAMSMPGPVYAWYGIVSPGNAPDAVLYEDAEKPAPITFYFKNVSPYAITLPAQPPMVRIGSTDAFPLTAWAGLRVPAHQEVTASVAWPHHPPGTYTVTLHGGTYVVDCIHQGMRIDGGGGMVDVLPPADQVLVGALQPDTNVTASGYTVRLVSVTMTRTGTTVVLWISGLHVPADQVRVSAAHDGQPFGPWSGGAGTREVPGGGEVTAGFAPTPVGTRQLQIQVDSIAVFEPGTGLRPVMGPWRFVVPVGGQA